jgi:hypothetical protein
VDVLAVLSLTSKSLELAKTLKDIDKQFGEAEWKAKAAELLSNMADVKAALVDLKDQMEAKDKEISRLKSAFEARGETVESLGFRFPRRPMASLLVTPSARDANMSTAS